MRPGLKYPIMSMLESGQLRVIQSDQPLCPSIVTSHGRLCPAQSMVCGDDPHSASQLYTALRSQKAVSKQILPFGFARLYTRHSRLWFVNLLPQWRPSYPSHLVFQYGTTAAKFQFQTPTRDGDRWHKTRIAK